mmetsp:Transcript_45675/g.119911  ORF Transcript_45675/g.119911 Transcript_45675/m.119911 type:complete len:234 (-) Transcript_45675:1309-2010(-)
MRVLSSPNSTIPEPSLSKMRKAALSSSSSLLSFIFFFIIPQNSPKSISPSPDSSTSATILTTSSSVGVSPSERMTVPSSSAEIAPEPSLSKSWKASLNDSSATSSSSGSGYGYGLGLPRRLALRSKNLRWMAKAALFSSGLMSWMGSSEPPPSSIVSTTRCITNQSGPICSPELVVAKAFASISMRRRLWALATRHSRTACSCTSAKVLPIIAMSRLSSRMSAMMRYMKRKAT